jgi:hypothetical protein
MNTTAARPNVKGFFDKATSSIQYVVSDPATKGCAIIDPVFDFDEKSGSTATHSADRILAFVEAEGLNVEWILGTHRESTVREQKATNIHLVEARTEDQFLTLREASRVAS